MKTPISKIKQNARVVQAFRWNSAALATLIFITLIDLMSTFVSYLKVNNLVIASILSIASTLVVSLLTVLLLSGYMYYFMNAARGVPSSVFSIFSIFKMQPDKFIIVGMFYSLAELALTIPDFILLFAGKELTGINFYIYIGWAVVRFLILYVVVLNILLAPMLLLDNPDMDSVEAIRTSCQLMKGNKGRLFRMHLSFIGWLLLGICSLLFGFLYIIPYFMAAHVQFYFDLIEAQ